MAGPVSVTRSWSVGPYRCTVTVTRPRPGAVVTHSLTWEPTQPRRLSAADIRQYRAGRDRALTEISRELGINAAVLEL